jgi:hypothetical protein
MFSKLTNWFKPKKNKQKETYISFYLDGADIRVKYNIKKNDEEKFAQLYTSINNGDLFDTVLTYMSHNCKTPERFVKLIECLEAINQRDLEEEESEEEDVAEFTEYKDLFEEEEDEE